MNSIKKTTWVKVTIALCIMLIFALANGTYHALLSSPPDYRQGNAVRIMYIHVPCAWMALSIYLFMSICSGLFFITEKNIMALIARSAAPIGTVMTFLCLCTGSIWGHPIWGTWWEWDARLTSMFILFIFYLSYIALGYINLPIKRLSTVQSIINILGVINIPIIKFSVNIWTTLHQKSSFIRKNGIAMDKAMMTPLFSMLIAIFIFVVLTISLQAYYKIHVKDELSK